jgi:hypothetical protein
MSCFVVNDYHVSALVAWAIRHQALVGVTPDALAHELAAANRAAFAERYAGGHSTSWEPYLGLDRSAGADLAPVAIVKACDCLAYQCSDWTGWDSSEAAAHLAAIRAAALHRATGGIWRDDMRAHRLPGYDAAAWTLPEPDQAEPDQAAEVDRLAAYLASMPEPDKIDRLAASLASMPEHEVDALRAALAATRCAA